MHLPLATIATAALLLSTSAIPFLPQARHIDLSSLASGRNRTSSGGPSRGRGRHSRGPFPTSIFASRSGVAAPTGGFPGSGTRPSRSGGAAAPTGGLPGSGTRPSRSIVTVAPTPTTVPSGGGDLESVSFAFPTSRGA
ncbi:hypothetical protein EK21DRAFT_113179 [Setomelanomma holmii]|uniref:Uncharacterized protein n=1 Tax=Setomelanomma holmii TaxID=210430 RepID=A0A9P4H8Q9_9PLEO|nr:hypothetical protein EK21DRAFT_113179 [Setomelanomma holmii]